MARRRSKGDGQDIAGKIAAGGAMRLVTLSTRVSEAEGAAVATAAESLGLSSSAFVRASVLALVGRLGLPAGDVRGFRERAEALVADIRAALSSPAGRKGPS